MDAVLGNLLVAAPAAPVRGIGSAARGAGPAEAEAAAGFAGILAAVPATSAAPPASATPGESVPVGKSPIDKLPAAAVPADASASQASIGAPVVAGQAAAATGTAITDAVAAAVPAPGEAATAVDGSAGAATDVAPPSADGATLAGAATVSGAVAAPVAAADAVAIVPVTTSATSPAAATATATGPLAGEAASALPDVAVAAMPANPANGGPAPATTTTTATTTPAAGAASAPVPAGAQPVVTAATQDIDAPSRVAADQEVPALAAAPLTVAAALEDAEPAVELAGPAVEASPDESQDAATTDQDAGDGASATAPDGEPAPHGPTAAEQALLGFGLHTYLKTAGQPVVRAAAVQAPPSATDDPATATVARPAGFAALVGDFLAADAASGTGQGLGLKLAGDLADPATVGQVRSQAAATAAASIRSQVAEQVGRSLQSARGEEKLTIRLSPEELGRVDVEFRAVDDRLTVTLRAATPEAEQALRSGARELTDGIIERSARFQHVEVRVESRDGGHLRADRHEERPQDQKQDGRQQDGRREARDGARNRPTGDQDSAREAWVRAFTDLSQPSQEV